MATSTTSGGTWLSVVTTAGPASPATQAVLSVSADPTGLSPGTYNGLVTVTSSNGATFVRVEMTISALDQAILLSQHGLSFTAVAGGGVVPSQTFSVLNIGSGSLVRTASASTLTGGAWPQVTPGGGSTDGAGQDSSIVTVSVSAAGLATGSYYGLVEVNAPSAANSPQALTVFLQVLRSGADLGAVVRLGPCSSRLLRVGNRRARRHRGTAVFHGLARGAPCQRKRRLRSALAVQARCR